jgi:multicomponent Na+:H+ antiporter subunit E
MRAVGFFALWVVLTGVYPTDVLTGVVATLAATWASLRLLAPSATHVRPVAVAQLGLRFLGQSVVAGVDVARRALDPRLPLCTGFVLYPTALPPGSMRHAFTTLMSLLPGTVPAGLHSSGALLIHCLDVEQPVTAQLAAEEALFSHLVGEVRGNG